MRFRIKTKQVTDGAVWWEDYDIESVTDINSAIAWAKRTIAIFNGTLRPGESARELLGVRIHGESQSRKHVWVKRTDGMSVMFRGAVIDRMFCEHCNVTGKRFGMSAVITRDSKWRAKKYENCERSR